MFDPFSTLDGIKVQSEKEGPLVVDNVGVLGCTEKEARSMLPEYFKKLLSARDSLGTQFFLRKDEKVAFENGVVLRTSGIIIRKEGS